MMARLGLIFGETSTGSLPYLSPSAIGPKMNMIPRANLMDEQPVQLHRALRRVSCLVNELLLPT